MILVAAFHYPNAREIRSLCNQSYPNCLYVRRPLEVKRAGTMGATIRGGESGAARVQQRRERYGTWRFWAVYGPFFGLLDCVWSIKCVGHVTPMATNLR
jgi:hypothetical protein